MPVSFMDEIEPPIQPNSMDMPPEVYDYTSGIVADAKDAAGIAEPVSQEELPKDFDNELLRIIDSVTLE